MSAAGVERFARSLIEAIGSEVAVFKPQSAFFEAYGSVGIAVLERVLGDLSDVGALSLLDVKRGDIGSTMDAYAAAYLADGAPLAADAITLSPYLGSARWTARSSWRGRTGRGAYVLALTSNPEGPQVQHARAADGRLIGQLVLDEVAIRNAGTQNSDGGPGTIGHVGVVVGATIGRRRRLLGAQRLDPGARARCPGRAPRRVWRRCSGPPGVSSCPSSSREILSRRTRTRGAAVGGPAGPRRDQGRHRREVSSRHSRTSCA